jgi:hypothetical protein
MRKHHKGRMEKYIQEQTMSGSMIVEFWLALASGQPFPMKRIVRLPMTSEQCAVAVGNATPAQRKIAKKQRRFTVVKEPYYPSVEDIKEAMYWLADRGFGKAPQIVPVETDEGRSGFTILYRKWPVGVDPAAQPQDAPRVIEGKQMLPPSNGHSNGHQNGQTGHTP